jgi:hypothetical protein
MWDSPFAKGGAAADCRGYDIELGADVWTAHVADGATFVTGTFSQTPVLARWISLAAVFDPGNELAVYADGQLVQAVPLVGFMSAASAAPADIGGAGDGCNFTSRFAGLVDEVRVASVARTSGWIATELADQSSPQTFARLVEP